MCIGSHVVAAFVVDETVPIICPALARCDMVHGLIGVRGGVRPQAGVLRSTCHLALWSMLNTYNRPVPGMPRTLRDMPDAAAVCSRVKQVRVTRINWYQTFRYHTIGSIASLLPGWSWPTCNQQMSDVLQGDDLPRATLI
jgi:hypothetical protein